jgi:methionyl-tRNA formyltransferase
MGTPESAVPSLRRLIEDGHDMVSVWTQPDRPAGRGEKIHSGAVKDFALAHKLPIQQPSKIKTDESKALFASHDADLAVVIAYGRILPKEYLTTPRLGCVNVHFSLLPKYRGAAPTNWAIVRGETTTGVTTMFIDEELDAGPILLQEKTAIATTETAPELMRRLAEMGAELLSKTVAQIGSITPIPQNDSEATFAPMLTKADGVIDWTTTSTEIERRVRGLQPWPNAYTSHNKRRLIIWRAEPISLEVGNAVPGQVAVARGDDLIVQCGEQTTLRLVEVQPEARRRMTVREFLSGSHLQIGEQFGQT